MSREYRRCLPRLTVPQLPLRFRSTLFFRYRAFGRRDSRGPEGGVRDRAHPWLSTRHNAAPNQARLALW